MASPDRDPPRLTIVGRDDASPPPVGDPPRRILLIAFVFVLLLAALGDFVIEKMIDVANLQDCAATGRRDC